MCWAPMHPGAAGRARSWVPPPPWNAAQIAIAQRLSLVAPDVLQRVHEILANDDVQAFRVTVELDGWQAVEL